MINKIVAFGNSITPYTNIITIISFLATVITLIITSRISKIVKKSDYRKNIREHVDALAGCCSTLRNDKTIVKDELFDDIWEHLDTIDIIYGEVIGKKLIKKVHELKQYISSEETRKPENFSECARRLSTFAKELKNLGEKF
nr:hypothetical protein [Clostridia bacterium]